MSKLINILVYSKDIINEIQTKYRQIDINKNTNINNKKLCDFLDMLLKHKDILNNIYQLKKKVISMFRDMYLKQDTSIIEEYYYAIFKKHIINSSIFIDSKDGNNLNMLVGYIQQRNKHILNTDVFNEYDNKVSEITI